MLRVILIGLLVVATAPAQGRRGGGGGGSRGGPSFPMGGPVVKNRLELMTEALQLSKEQKKDVKTVMDAGQKDAAPLREQMVKGRAQIAAAIQGGKQDEIDAAIKSYSELDAQMTAIEMKAFAAVYKALDQDQKQRSRTIFDSMPGIFANKNWLEVPQP